MPRGVKKVTAKSIQAEIEKQQFLQLEKQEKITQYKQEYTEKVKKLKQEIAVAQRKIQKLERQYQKAVQEEQREMLSAILFQSNLSVEEVNNAIHGVEILFSESGDKQDAVRIFQKLAAVSPTPALNDLVDSLKQPPK